VSVVGVDVGGTFTDVVLRDGDGRVHVRKVVTTPEDPRVGVVDGIGLVLDDAGVAAADVARVVHGTTLATNVILERRGGRVAFVATEGFGDLLRLGREARVEDDRYDLFFAAPHPPVEHELTFEARERVTATGAVRTPLTDATAREVAARVAAASPDAVAVCFLHSYAEPAHEARMAAALRDALDGDVFVVTSSGLWPEMREYERAMTTVLCAYVGPTMHHYLGGLAARLADLGVRCPVEVMDSGGGVMSAALAARRPVYTVESGGAAGVTAAGLVGRLLGAGDVISFDMGGTTAKAGIVRDGHPDITHDFQVGGKGSFGGTRPGTGYPLKIPVVDLAEVGAGGGSIASVDGAGAVQVGPRSSGSVPGPACYGRGGTEPTVTDANLVLGYLDAHGLAGGVTLSPDAAGEALERVLAAPLGVDVVAAARAVHEVATASMAAAIHVVTVQRGIDPRRFTLVAFGGAGPLHAAGLAVTFGITSIAVPWAAGVASAVGLVGADLAVDRVRTHLVDLDGADPTTVESVFASVEAEARAELADADVVVRSVDARFRGQAHQLTMPADGPIDEWHGRFRAHYLAAYGIDLDAPVQLVNFRVRVVRRVPDALAPPDDVVATDPSPALAGERPAWFAATGGFVATPVYRWPGLGPGSAVDGPALVEGHDATIVVPPGHRATVDRWRNVRLSPPRR
jgi:N-methylhydantoinase A